MPHCLRRGFFPAGHDEGEQPPQLRDGNRSYQGRQGRDSGQQGRPSLYSCRCNCCGGSGSPLHPYLSVRCEGYYSRPGLGQYGRQLLERQHGRSFPGITTVHFPWKSILGSSLHFGFRWHDRSHNDRHDQERVRSNFPREVFGMDYRDAV